MTLLEGEVGWEVGSSPSPLFRLTGGLWLGTELEREQRGLTSVQAAVLPPCWDHSGKGDLVPAWPNALY